MKDQWVSERVGWSLDNGELTGAAQILYRQFPGTRKYFAYLPEGPVADWSDPEIDRWLGPLLRHLRKAGAFAVRIGPMPAYRRWDAARLKASTGAGRRIATSWPPRSTRSAPPSPNACGPGAGSGAAGTTTVRPTHSPATSSGCRSPAAAPSELWAGLNQEWRRNVRAADRAGVQMVDRRGPSTCRSSTGC